MNDAERFLVIVLSSFLALVLLLFVIVLVKVIQILNYLKKVSESAVSVAHNVENVSAFFEKTAAPVAIGKLIANITDNVLKRNKKREK